MLTQGCVPIAASFVCLCEPRCFVIVWSERYFSTFLYGKHGIWPAHLWRGTRVDSYKIRQDKSIFKRTKFSFFSLKEGQITVFWSSFGTYFRFLLQHLKFVHVWSKRWNLSFFIYICFFLLFLRRIAYSRCLSQIIYACIQLYYIFYTILRRMVTVNYLTETPPI